MTRRINAEAVLEVAPLFFRFVSNEVKATDEPKISFAHYRVIAFLALGASTNSQAADRLGVSVAAMSRMIDGLVRKGWITRRDNPDDRRQVLLELSEQGRLVQKAVREQIKSKLDVRLSGLEDGQREALLRGLGILKELFA